jgi:hypothetical protein
MKEDQTVQNAVKIIADHAASGTPISGPVLDTATRALSRNSTWTAAFCGFLETPGDPDLQASVEFMLQRVAVSDPAFLGQLRAAVDSESPPSQSPSAESSAGITVFGSKNKIKDVAGRDVNKNRTIRVGSGALAVLLLAGGGTYTAYKVTHSNHLGAPQTRLQGSLPFPESAYAPPPGTLCLLSRKEASALEGRKVKVPPKFNAAFFCEYLPPNSGLSFTKIGLEVSAYADTAAATDNGKYPLNGEKINPSGQFTAAWVWPTGLAAARLPSGAYLTLSVRPSGSASRRDLIEGIDLIMRRFHYDPRLRAAGKGDTIVPIPK